MPDYQLEQDFGSDRGLLIIGLDEVGRGPWAGPVAAGAAWLPPECLSSRLVQEIDDSKALSKRRRGILAAELWVQATVAIGWASVAEIDELNILAASMLAMRRAAMSLDESLEIAPSGVLVDGNRLPDLPWPARAVVKGDARSLSIAAASIVAKVARDQEMVRLAELHPGYGWERNSGYGTAEHRLAIAAIGLTEHHRRSFKPIREAERSDGPGHKTG